MISKSSLIRLDGGFPAENGYAEIADSHVMVSGETGNSSQVLAKWGHLVKVDGPWLGDNNRLHPTSHRTKLPGHRRGRDLRGDIPDGFGRLQAASVYDSAMEYSPGGRYCMG